MAVVTLNKKELKRITNADDEKLDNLLNLFGLGVEKIDKESVDVEVTPNRPDMLSQSGILRALSTYLGRKRREYKVKKSGYKLIVEKSLPKQWPYAFSCIVKGLKFNDEKIKEVIDIQEKLGSTLMRNRKKGGIGIYPLEKINFPIKFIGMKPDEIKFRPLEYPDIITGRQILSKHPTGREYAFICQDWDKFPVFVDNKGIIMSMPPIINSHDVGKIDETTKEVFVEVTGNDFYYIQKALTIIVTSLADMGGEIYSIECKQQNGKTYSIPNLHPEKIRINLENVNKLLGLSLKEAEIKKLLEKMGHEYKNKTVFIPCYRTDIMHPVDLTEDIAIAYGYQNFIPEIPEISTIGEENEKEVFKREISEVLAGLGMLETSSLHLLTKEDFEKAGVKPKIEVEKSKSDYKFLRNNLLISALKILGENIDSEYPQKIFELGRVFELKEKEETGIEEQENLVISLAPGNFTELKQVLDYLFRMLNLEYKIEEDKSEGFIEGRTGKIIFNNKKIGVIGEIKPEVLKSWKIKMPLACLELNVDELI